MHAHLPAGIAGALQAVPACARGIVATDPHEPEKIEHADTVSAWVELNRDALLAHRRGDIDGAEMTLRTKPVPITGG